MRRAGLAVGVAVFGLVPEAGAETLRWIGPPGGSWTVPEHWSPAKIPFEGDTLLFQVEGEASVDFDYPHLTARSAIFRQGATQLLGATIHEHLFLEDDEPINLPALTVADESGLSAAVTSEVALTAPMAAIGLAGEGVWATEAEMRVDDLFIGVRAGASGIVSLRGSAAALRRRFNEPMNRVTVGFQGDGVLELRHGATADITQLRLGIEPGSHGRVDIDGADSAVSIESLSLGAGAATIATRDGGTVVFPDGYHLEDRHGPSDTLTFDGVTIDGIRRIELVSGRGVRVRNGSELHLAEALEAGEFDAHGPATRVTTQVIEISGTASIAGGAAIEIVSRDYFGSRTAGFMGGLYMDDGRLFVDRVAEGGGPSILAIGSVDGPPDQQLRLVNGAVIDAEGLLSLSFSVPSEARGDATVIRQRTHLVGGPFPSSPIRPGGLLQLVSRRFHLSDPFVRLDIVEGAVVRGTSVELGAEVHVGDAALIADEIMIIVLNELIVARGAEVRTPRLLVRDSARTPSGDQTVLRGDGSVVAAVSNGGVIDPGPAGATGSLQISGSLNQARHVIQLPASHLLAPSSRVTGEGSLHIDIAFPADHDRLEVTGAALLGGTLEVALLGGFAPAWGDDFTVLTAGAIDGAFETLDLPDAPAGFVYELEYTDTAATLSLQRRTDITRDLVVGAEDLGALLMKWGTADDHADLTDDGVVDGADLGVLLGDWGAAAR